MKFGKRLKQQIRETLPSWRDKYLSYKDLKKLVRLISSSAPHRPCDGSEAEFFLCLLNNEIEKFNAFFVEQEEDFVIRSKELQQRIGRAMETKGAEALEMDSDGEMARIRRDIVNFHGEMVLLINYSNINYTGLGKILKKYDKRTGGLLRSPFIQKVLEQPFFTTDLISKLIKECESTIDALFSPVKGDEAAEMEAELPKSGGGVGMEAMEGEEGIFRNTVAALWTMREIRKGSSTYSHLSLPPLNLPESELIQSFQLHSPLPII